MLFMVNNFSAYIATKGRVNTNTLGKEQTLLYHQMAGSLER